MSRLQLEILELFAEQQGHVHDRAFANALDWRQRKAAWQAAYDAARAKLIRCVPELRAKRKASQSAYEKRRWQKVRADEARRRAHNAKRRAAHARLKADPRRLAVAKAKQAVHSRRQTSRRKQRRSWVLVEEVTAAE